MGLFSIFFKPRYVSSLSSNEPEHAVILNFKYGRKELSSLHRVEDKLRRAISKARAGEYDGHEIAIDGSDGTMYMYGSNAETLFNAIRPTLEKVAFMKGAVATLRFGPPKEDTKSIEIEI